MSQPQNIEMKEIETCPFFDITSRLETLNRIMYFTNTGVMSILLTDNCDGNFNGLEEKQKLRVNYGLSEKQLMNYVKKAKGIKGATGSILLQLLEMRLDNLIFRLEMAPTIAAAR